MINNFKQVAEFLNFDTLGSVYRIMICQRRKDFSGDDATIKKNTKVLDMFYIRSLDEFINLEQKIVDRCAQTNSRAYISTRGRTDESVAKKTMCLLAEHLYYNEFRAVEHIYDKAFGNAKTFDKWFLIDYDNNDDYSCLDVLNHLQSYVGKDGKKIDVKMVVPTRDGVHIVTTPFDKTYLLKKYKTEIKVDGQLLLI
jgi:hypothetical protein